MKKKNVWNIGSFNYQYQSRLERFFFFFQKTRKGHFLKLFFFLHKIVKKEFLHLWVHIFQFKKKKKNLRGRGGAWLHHWNWWASSAKETFPSLNIVTFIWFNVRVLVLSLQMVVAKPMALQVESFRTVTWSTIILFM